MDLAQAQAQRANIVKELQRRGGAANAPGFAQQLRAIDANIRGQRANPTTPETAQEQPVTEQPAPSTPTPDNSELAQKLTDALFTTSPTADEVTGSEQYKNAMNKGTLALNAQNAARGLTGSTAESNQFGTFYNDLYDKEFGRQQEDKVRKATTLYSLLNDTANRETAASNETWDRYMSLLNTMYGMAPTQEGWGAATGMGGLATDAANKDANYIANGYKRPTVGMGSGGTGTAAPQYSPMFPTSPNFFNPQLMSILNSGAGNINQGSILSGVLSSLLK